MVTRAGPTARYQSLATAGIVLMLLTATVSARTLNMLVPTHRHFVLTSEVAGRFASLVAAQSGGELEIRMHGPDVVPPFHQFEPVQAGAFELLYTGPSYHSGNVPAAVALGGIGGGPEVRRRRGICLRMRRNRPPKTWSC